MAIGKQLGVYMKFLCISYIVQLYCYKFQKIRCKQVVLVPISEFIVDRSIMCNLVKFDVKQLTQLHLQKLQSSFTTS